MEYLHYYNSPLGIIRMASTDGLTLSSLKFIDGNCTDTSTSPLPEILHHTAKWLENYFNRIESHHIPELSLHGTEFQKMVWRELMRIPRGTTVTYGELARRLNVRSARAIGQAVKRNQIAIVIPCHRVVGINDPGGYAYGLLRKTSLLSLER